MPIGRVRERKLQASYFEWEIPDFFVQTANPEECCYSPNFEFSGYTWYLKFFPQNPLWDEWASLFLCKKDSSIASKAVTFTLGFKKGDGELVEQTPQTYTFEQCESSSWEWKKFLLRSDLNDFSSELLSSDTLILTCRIVNHQAETMEEIPQVLSLVELETLSSNFRDLLINGKKCDATIIVKDKEFLVHRAVLTARSSVFAAMFEHNMSEEETGIVKAPDCEPNSFGDFLNYLYTGKVESLSSEKALNLYVTADKYDVQELKSFSVICMKGEMTAENVCDVFALAYQYDETELLSAAQDYFNRNVTEILLTTQWEIMLKKNYLLANKLLKTMASKVKILY